MKNWRTIFVLVLCGLLYSFSDEKKQEVYAPPPYIDIATPWADSVLETLTLEERIGQLFMIPAYSKGNHLETAKLHQLVDSHKVGGIIFMQGGPVRQVEMINEIQRRSKTPVMIAMDAEWGLGMRLDSTISYPWQMALGATRDPEVVYRFGKEAARQLSLVGTHVSFSPVVDVNNNPINPVINARSFGEDVQLVSLLGDAYMRGLQDSRVLACAKHFPGHGDTDVDSHEDLPVILHSRGRLDSLEHRPFQFLIDRGLGSTMAAHLYIPALDSTPELASTLSTKIVNDLLKVQMGFRGLVFTDALTMKGVAKFHEPGELEVKALIAGNDILLFPSDVPIATQKIKAAIESGRISEAQITEKCHMVLKVKEWSGLHEFSSLETENLAESLNNSGAQALHKELAEKSLTLLRDDKNLLPVPLNSSKKIAVLNIGKKQNPEFNKALGNYLTFDNYHMSENPNFSTSKEITAQLKGYDLVIVAMATASRRVSKNYGINQQAVRVINRLSQTSDVIFCAFNNPYGLGRLHSPATAQAILVGYHDTKVTQQAMADAIVGAAPIGGRLPVSVSEEFGFGAGLDRSRINILRKVNPEQIGVSESRLLQIDSIALEGIAEQAYPGCRVLALKDGQLFYDKSFGHLTYEEKTPVTEETIYDLASITKVAASTFSLMRLQDEGKINVDYNLCDYLDICDTSDYYNMNLTEMLSHHARLKSWIPFYLQTIEDGSPNPDLYRKSKGGGFTTEVAKGLYINDNYRDSIYDRILNTALRSKREYKYSDLGYYFVQDIIERHTGNQLESFVDSAFYKPLGLESMGYLPLNSHDKNTIAPTEYDMKFRKQLVHGHVHDPGAAMMGGVGGHAGLFSNGYDLALLMQLFMSGGEYAGTQYISESTLDYFTQCHFCDEDNRRGIGFDKPTYELDRGPTCNSASLDSFGHSGFTGTLAWADPEHGIVYVFLSNRIYPNSDNRKLLKMDIRTRIQQVIYDAFDIPDREVPEDVVHN